MIFAPADLGDAELGVLAEIDDVRAALRYSLVEPRRWTGTLRRTSFARNVQGSNSIEGLSATLVDAAAVIDGDAPLEASEQTTRAIQGYRDAMTYVLQLCDEDGEFTYSAQLIKALHFMMTSYDLANRPGRWRAGDIFVHSGTSGEIVYTGPDVETVPPLIAELVAQLNAPSQYPLVDAAMAHLNLVMIHPFRDGNGRMARCLQSLVLGREGIVSPVFMSVEEYLGRNTGDYYRVLADVGGGVWSPQRDTRTWIRFMLTAHLRQARTQRQRIRDYERLWLELVRLLGGDEDARTLPALLDAAVGLRITRSGYARRSAENGEPVSDQSAGRDLKRLVDAGWLVTRGERRWRYYLAGEPVASLWRQIRADHPAPDDSDPFAIARV